MYKMNCQPPICITNGVYVGLLDECQASCQIPFMGPQIQPMCLDWAAAPILAMVASSSLKWVSVPLREQQQALPACLG